MALPFNTLLDARHQPRWRVLFALLIVAISWLAFSPAAGPDGVQHLDKARHLLAFAVLAGVAALAWRPASGAAARVALGLLAYGVLIEVVQTRIPGRAGSAADVAADAVGIALGLWLVRRVRHSR